MRYVFTDFIVFDKLAEVNPQQLEIIESFGQGQAVIAGAGCGKTTTLVAKCIALVRNRPESRFCAVSFTEKSVRDLKESLRKGFEKQGVELTPYRHWIKTIHGLCLSIIQEFPVEAGLLGGERVILQDEAEDLWERSLYILWTRNDNPEISESVQRLLKTYSRQKLESNFKQLRSLFSFGVESWIEAIQDRQDLKDLWLVFRSVFDRFQLWKTKAGVLDFNDLERYALTALEHARVRKHYHERFDLVLVDEFQDTNPVQGEIFERLVKPGFSNLCIVGDPKQSIYRFRDADVSVFQDLIKRVPRTHLLNTNYRSVPAIIDFVNQVCAPVFEASELDYESLYSGREAAQNHDSVLKLVITSERSLARYLKEQEIKGADLSEYVILSRSIRRDKTQKYLNALDELEVPFLLGSGGRFYSDPRVQELCAFLKAWTSPNHTLSMGIALRAPWIGISDQQIFEWKDDLFGNFFKSSDHPIAKALKELYLSKAPARPGEVLEKIWDALPDASELEMPIASLWHRVEEMSSQGHRFEEVVHVLLRAIEEEKIEKEVPPPASKGMVRIMTIHASKGLQFPRVILLDFEGPERSAGAANDFIWNRKKGIHLVIRDENGERDKKNSLNTEWGELEKTAAAAESKRVFYVAITRAQEQLILAWKKEGKEREGRSLTDDDWRAWIDLTGVEIKTVEVTSEEAIAGKKTKAPKEIAKKKKIMIDPKPFRPRHSPSEWMVLSQCEMRYQKKFISPDWVDEETHDFETENIGESVAEKGIRIHALLEHEDWKGLAAEFESPEVGARVVETLQEVLSSGKVFRELGFEVPFPSVKTGDEALVGMIDRLEVEREKGIVHIIDYKWTQKQKTPEEMRASYQLQLELYAWAAIQMARLPELKKLETKLIHFSKSGMNVIEVDIDPNGLDQKISRLYEKAVKALELHRQGEVAKPTAGEYCRYCEFVSICPLS